MKPVPFSHSSFFTSLLLLSIKLLVTALTLWRNLDQPHCHYSSGKCHSSHWPSIKIQIAPFFDHFFFFNLLILNDPHFPSVVQVTWTFLPSHWYITYKVIYQDIPDQNIFDQNFPSPRYCTQLFSLYQLFKLFKLSSSWTFAIFSESPLQLSFISSLDFKVHQSKH